MCRSDWDLWATIVVTNCSPPPLTRGQVIFDGAKFARGQVTFHRAEFTGGEVTFDGAECTGGRVTFDEAQSGQPAA